MEHLGKHEIIDILQKFAGGETSVVEEEQLNAYLKTVEDIEYEELLGIYYQLLGDAKDHEASYDHILRRVKQKAQERGYLKPVTYSRWFRFAAAALVILTTGAGLYFYTISVNQKPRHMPSDHIVMGQNKAVLTLANGQQIILNDASNGEIANQTGIKITKSANGQLIYNVDPKTSAQTNNEKEAYNTISTPKGGRYQVNLPDGTKVWLNASSSLTYPTHFSTNGRQVTLSGEAYFEVAKLSAKIAGKPDRSVSFSVRTALQEVMVLGTQFNVNAYPNETSTKTTLLEGSVKVIAKDVNSKDVKSNQGDMLKPGEQALLEAGKIKVKNVEPLDAIAWKDGYLQFQDEGIRAIMRKIERTYDVEVRYEGQINDEPIGGHMLYKNKTLADILNALEETDQFKFKVEGRRITVMP